MSAGLPKQLDIKRLASASGQIQGSMECLPEGRLTGLILECLAPVAVTLQAKSDGTNRVLLTGSIQGDVSMRCQRCLEPVNYHLTCDVNLGVVSSEAEAEQLPDEYDPLVIVDDQVNLVSLVEDELILALPLVPVHDDCQPPNGTDGNDREEQGVERENPFAVLKTLKRDDKSG